jgi:antitoxin PrlF
MSTTLTAKGQVTIPKPNRHAMGLNPGTSIDFVVNRNGEVVLHKAHSGHASRKTRPQPDRLFNTWSSTP